jgi:DNA-binding SARP family transcriptional activator
MIDICLFGAWAIYDSDRRLSMTEFHGVKPRLVLGLLALNLGRPISKERLADHLWAGTPPPSWLSTLEGYVSLLRKAVAPLGKSNSAMIISRNGGYLLNADQVGTDLDRFDRLLVEARAADASRSLRRLHAALEIPRGEVLLGERSLPWILETRERYQRERHRAAVQAGRLALSAGDIEAAGRYGKLACDLDPLAEDAWQILIESEWRANRRADALRNFSALRAMLDRELGITPCRALQQLFTRVLRDEPYGLSA